MAHFQKIPNMALTLHYTLVCEDVRVEDNGKFIILGLFTPDLVVPSIPFVVPSLTFAQAISTDTPGAFPFHFAIQQLETGRTIGRGMGIMPFSEHGWGLNVIRLANVLFERDGTYTLSVAFDRQEPFTLNFGITIRPQQQRLPTGD